MLFTERLRALEHLLLDLVQACCCTSSTDLSCCTDPLLAETRETSTTCPFSISRGPSSMRSGTPRISYSLNFQPGTDVGAIIDPNANARLLQLAHTARPLFAITCSRVFGGPIGIMMTCVGATFGGSTSPRSSPCTMISAPIRRVLTPQEVVCTY